MIRALVLALGLFATGSVAQAQVAQAQVAQAAGATLRGLDKLSGEVLELQVKTGETVALGWLQITLEECRYPVENPTGDAYAWLVIRSGGEEVPVFEGWMIASSPALSALDNTRYDVWVLRCTTD